MTDSHAMLRGPSSIVRKGDTSQTDVHDSIARMRTPTVLEPARRETLRIIHEEAADLRPVDLFRELRAQLLLACGRDNPIILVSGVRRQCGASFVARNLAAAIALDPDHSAVLVDCNLRRPSVERDFDLDDGPGLSDHLLSPGHGLASAIRPCGIPRLRIIGAGREPAAAAELISSSRMRSLLEELQQRYPDRCVILDAPAARGGPEARVLGQWADRALLVVGEGMHRASQVTDAAAAFEPARFAGVVFNQLP